MDSKKLTEKQNSESQTPTYLGGTAQPVSFFETVAEAVVNMFGYDLVWIGCLEDTFLSQVVIMGKGDAKPKKLPQKVSLLSSQLPGIGLAKQAVKLSKPAIDLHGYFVTEAGRYVGRSMLEGLCAGGVFPVGGSGEVGAVLACFSRDKNLFSQERVARLEELVERLVTNLNIQGWPSEPKPGSTGHQLNNEIFHSLIDSLGFPLIVFEPKDKSVVYANPKAAQGRSITAQPCYQILFQRDSECCGSNTRCPVMEVLATAKEAVTLHTITQPEGEDQLLEVHAVPLLNGDGEITQIFEYVVDVTGRRLEEEAGQSEQFQWKSRFVATVSHELRTPVAIIHGFAGLLLESQMKQLPAGQANHVKQICEHSSNLLVLLDRVLDLAKSRAGAIEIKKTQLNLSAVCREAVDMMELEFKRGKLGFAIDIPVTPIFVFGEKVAITQILLNLLTNARKYATKGDVVVWLREDEDVVRFGVRDTGIGIGKENHELIFEEFQQVVDEGIMQPMGIGLGLALCRTLVNAHGWSIKVESELDQGSNFIVELPKQPIEECMELH